MIIKEVLDRTTIFFKEKNFDSPRLDAEILLAKALGLKRIDLYLKFENPLSEQELEICRAFVRRRANGEPVAYILEQKDFYGETFKVNQNVLIPRPETELLVEEVISWVKKNNLQDTNLKILDLGSGSGCIGLTLLRQLPQAQATLLDVSSEAIHVATLNAQNLHVMDRAHFVNQSADVADFSNHKFDIIVANPPYIDIEDTEIMPEVKKFEPHLALFASDKGKEFLKAWSTKYAQHLNAESVIAFEFGHKQAEMMKEHFQKLLPKSNLKIVSDLSGFQRHIFAFQQN